MKITKETLAILKNFAGINPNILISKGSRLATISAQKNVLAEVTVTEAFPVDFGIYDLNEFLGVFSLYDDPEVEFKDGVAYIGNPGEQIRYVPADAGVLTLPPAKKINFPTPDVEFDLSAAEIIRLVKTASVLKATDVSVVGKDGDLTLVVSDIKNSMANSYRRTIGQTDKEFQANIKVDNLKMIHQDYTVAISSKKISRWTAKTGDMTVFVAIEANSTF